MTDVMTAAGIPTPSYRAEADPADTDRQTLLFWYPSVTTAPDDYIRSAVKIEAGVLEAGDEDGVYTLAFDADSDYSTYRSVYVTLEPKDAKDRDSVPGEKVLDGFFPL